MLAYYPITGHHNQMYVQSISIFSSQHSIYLMSIESFTCHNYVYACYDFALNDFEIKLCIIFSLWKIEVKGSQSKKKCNHLEIQDTLWQSHCKFKNLFPCLTHPLCPFFSWAQAAMLLDLLWIQNVRSEKFSIVVYLCKSPLRWRRRQINISTFTHKIDLQKAILMIYRISRPKTSQLNKDPVIFIHITSTIYTHTPIKCSCEQDAPIKILICTWIHAQWICECSGNCEKRYDMTLQPCQSISLFWYIQYYYARSLAKVIFLKSVLFRLKKVFNFGWEKKKVCFFLQQS